MLVLLGGCDALFGLDDLHTGPYFDAPPDRDFRDVRAIGDGMSDPRLLARFDFEDNYEDAVSGQAATCVSAAATCPGFTDGVHGRALLLDGVDDCLQFPLPSLPMHFTIAVRIYRNDDVPETAVAKPYASTAFDSWQIDTAMVRQLRYVTYNGSAERALLFDDVVEPGAWLHVAVTYDGGMKAAYVNGSALTSSSVGEGVITDGSAMLIGCDRDSAQYSRMFSGRLDEVVVYDEELGPPEIAALAQ